MADFRVRGHAVRQAYALLGLSRTEFAAKAGISPKTLTNITTASGKPAARTTLATAAKIAAALGWDVEQVLDEAKRPRDNRPAPTPKGTPPPQRDQPKRTPKNEEIAA